jgi:cobalt-zinc-cadmium efflux system outer membrane protein
MADRGSADLKSYTEVPVIYTRNHGEPAGSIGLAQVEVKRLGLLLSCVVYLSVPAAAGPRSIASLIEEAYQKNPNVHFYEQEIAAARGGRRTAGSWPNPNLSGQIGGKIYNSLGGTYLGTGPVWTVSLTQTFEFPGRVTLRKAIADKQIALARIGLEQFRLFLRNQIELLCYRLLAAQDRAAAATEVAQRFRDLIAVLVQREAAGTSPLIEMRILEGNAAILNRRATQAQIELQSARFELNLLRGVSMSLPVDVARQNVNLPTLPDSGRLMARADERNFDLRTRRNELEQQGFRVRLAHNEQWPAVKLGPYTAGEHVIDSKRELGLALSMPLPFWNQARGSEEAASARLNQAEVSLHTAMREVEQKIMTAAESYKKELKRLRENTPQLLGQLHEAAKLADDNYRLGVLPISTYTEIQSQYLEGTDAVLNSRLDALRYLAELEYLSGEQLHDVSLPNSQQKTFREETK